MKPSGYNVSLIADSINPVGNRLTTFELTYPRFVHAQLMTHRLFSRNAASSRAIPTKKLIDRVLENPVMPLFWGKNQSGMQAQEELQGADKERAIDEWLIARLEACKAARRLLELGVHKQIVNRVIEPWMFITVIVSATEYENWFHLRQKDAQPEIAWVAGEMHELYTSRVPKELKLGEWHLPYVELEDKHSPLYVDFRDTTLSRASILRGISTARCARVSYLTHDGKRDPAADIALHDRLAESGHWSPFEHVAEAFANRSFRSGNFFGWRQYRKLFENEHYGRMMQ